MYFSLPRWCYELLGIIILLIGSYVYGLYQHHEGAMSVKIAEAKIVADTTIKSGDFTNRLVVQYNTQVQYIKGATLTIERQVPIYVTKEDDQRCPVPNGFVQLWNATNKMQLPNTSGGVNAGTSNIVLSDIAAQHTRESRICQLNEQQVRGLQDWIRGQQAVYSR